MTIATAPLRHTQVAAVGGAKRFSVTRKSLSSSGVSPFDSIFHVKFNPDWSEGLVAGVAAEAATVEIDATDIILQVDASPDRDVTFSGLTVQEMIDAINATESDGTNRWRAGLADVAPNVVLVPKVASALDAMLGYLDGVEVGNGDDETVFLAVGTDRGERGAGNFLPDGFNTNYDYPLTRLTGGLADPLTSQVGRAGGVDASQGEDVLSQRRSAFRKSPAALAQERYSSAARFVTVVDAIWTDIIVPDGGNDDVPILVKIFDGSGSLVWSELGGAVPPIHFTVPSVTVRGPAYITVGGDGSGADNEITDGSVTVTGFTRRA